MAIGDSTRINTNLAALNAVGSMQNVNRKLEKVQLRLATGTRINEVADSPADFVMSQRLLARIRGLAVALDNTANAKNVIAIAEGGLGNISDILITIKEKVTQSANDTFSSAERDAISTEIGQLTAEIDNIVAETTFNATSLLDGTYTGNSYQTGEDTDNSFRFSITQDHRSAGLEVDAPNVGSRVFTATGSLFALGKVDTAIETVSDSLQQIGAVTVRLGVKESTLSVAIANTTATRSRILDSDMARDQLDATRLQILQQTSTAQLSQANIAPRFVLTLFR